MRNQEGEDAQIPVALVQRSVGLAAAGHHGEVVGGHGRRAGRPPAYATAVTPRATRRRHVVRMSARSLSNLLQGVAATIVVVVKDGSRQYVDAAVLLRIAPKQRPLQVAPHYCGHTRSVTQVLSYARNPRCGRMLHPGKDSASFV